MKSKERCGSTKDDEWKLDPCRMWLVHLGCWRSEKPEECDLISWAFYIKIARMMEMMLLISRRETKGNRCHCYDEEVLLLVDNFFFFFNFKFGSFGKFDKQ